MSGRADPVAKATHSGGVASVERALQILHLFREGRRSLSVTQVAAELGVANSTAHRLLRSLCNGGFLQQDAPTKRYGLSLLLYRLGNLAVTHTDLYQRALAPLERLYQATGEGCHVAVADLPDVVYLERRDSDRTMQFIARMGVRAPANCTSTGKVLLAHTPARALDDVLANGLTRLTAHSITDARQLAEELVTIRERGYAQSCDESELGTTSVAAPIRDGDGAVVAAVGLAGLTARMHRLSLERVVEVVVACGSEISLQLSQLNRLRGASFPQGGIALV